MLETLFWLLVIYFGLIAANIFLNLLYPLGMKETYNISLLIVFYVLSPFTIIGTINDFIKFYRDREKDLAQARLKVRLDLVDSKYQNVDNKTLTKIAEYISSNLEILELPTFLEMFEEMEKRNIIYVENDEVHINNENFLLFFCYNKL